MKKRKIVAAGIVLTASLSALPVQTKAEITSPEVYIALGDSVAAGVTPNESVDAGYTDIIAAELGQSGLLAAFSKDFAVPGFTTSNVLELFDNEAVRDSVSQATMITLSAGANNVLGLVQQDDLGQTVSYNQLTANFALNNMRIEYGEILDTIQELNPDADIYAIGYYFPYPHVKEKQQDGVRKVLETVNTIIQNEAESRGLTYVPVAEEFNAAGTAYLPNPTDVHPNQEGYVSIANSFFDVAAPFLEASINDIPPNPGLSPFIQELLEQNPQMQMQSSPEEAEQPEEMELEGTAEDGIGHSFKDPDNLLGYSRMMT
ncbi:SGNH/GDSL hydrolase family protein [Jeotgalibacillus aurantiacus]|uniref:SGNH/GDSL hydrolase family protein n=1 Tax=Jeotgalibacillus aurantiacus TaxID=2763266 RepID=UPI001D09DB24|nr:GDSL-type esterase/lipase family protein [Jeotgalibacillus aurantiacus]